MAEKKNPFRVDEFRGMNNIKQAEGTFEEPRIVLNADVTEEGRIVKRDGYTKLFSLTDAHSLWAGNNAMLCVDNGTLYRIQQGNKVSLCTVNGPKSLMSYADVDDLVYMSNYYWHGIFDPADNSISDWGIDLPEQPVITSTTGSLPAGTYHVCFTISDGVTISGNGPIAQIILSSGNSGISISNRPVNGIVWVTDPDGGIFHPVGEYDTILSTPGVEPMPSFLCGPPPYMRYLTYAFGRIWGTRDSILYYSESFHLDWFKQSMNRFDFHDTITLIAMVPTGLFVGCATKTQFLKGTNPKEMQIIDAGPGAVPNTLQYCDDLGELGDIISPPEKTHVDVPVWVGHNGIVAGNQAGRLFSLSERKVKFAPGSEGASLFRKKNGRFQFLTSFKAGSEGSGFGISDDATCEVIRNGTLI